MAEDSVVSVQRPAVGPDPLTALLRSGARQLLQQAVEAELTAGTRVRVLAHYAGQREAQGRAPLMRNGYPAPQRSSGYNSQTASKCQSKLTAGSWPVHQTW